MGLVCVSIKRNRHLIEVYVGPLVYGITLMSAVHSVQGVPLQRLEVLTNVDLRHCSIGLVAHEWTLLHARSPRNNEKCPRVHIVALGLIFWLFGMVFGLFGMPRGLRREPVRDVGMEDHPIPNFQ